MLAVFKYLGFFSEIARDLGLSSSTLSIVVPVGISFFTFQTMSYSIDIYRGKLKPSDSWLEFAVYVCFFPQLVAGPIVRAVDFIPQVRKRAKLNFQEHYLGLYLMMLGFLKKVCFADLLALNLVDRVFESPELFSSIDVLFACYAYSVQIYCDFSGYSDIAIGAAYLLGFRLPVNFNRPFCSKDLQEFWRRWHISLSSWLRDYLYISIGGSRGNSIMTYRNLIVTMVLGGLWHGASWNFVVWGVLHGVALAGVRMFQRKASSVNWLEARKRSWFWKQISHQLTFHYVVFCFVVFRATDLDVISRMLQSVGMLSTQITTPWWVLSILLGGLCLHWLPTSLEERVRNRFLQFSPWNMAIAMVCVLSVCQSALVSEVVPFIYFQF